MKTTISKGKIFSAIFSILLLAGLTLPQSLRAEGTNKYKYEPQRSGEPEVPAGFVGIGPVVAGSVNYDALPSKARKFLEKYCDGHAVVRCEKRFTSGE